MSDRAVATRHPCGITAIVVAYRRLEQTLVTLERLKACDPPPAEILLHVDGGEGECAAAIAAAHPDVRMILSAENVGPGGGRNKLVQASASPVVASFDDDSYPIDRDYFRRLASLFKQYPEATVVSAAVFHLDEPIQADTTSAAWVSDFAGGACAYRRDEFLAVGGYVPLTVAYGMEEVDFAIRLYERGGRVLHSPWLRVFHDTDRARHADPSVTAGSIANLALLTYLRYPHVLWPLGLGQCLRRIVWSALNGRTRGIAKGLLRVPSQLRKYRGFRGRVPVKSVLAYLALRRRPIAVGLPGNSA